MQCTKEVLASDLTFFYIQIKIYNVSYILLYLLIITIRHYRDDSKRSDITRLPHCYMKRKRGQCKKIFAKKQFGNENIDQQHKSKYDDKLRVKVACCKAIPDINKSET